MMQLSCALTIDMRQFHALTTGWPLAVC